MKNLGRLFILILFIPLSLMATRVASVEASVDSPVVERGEMVTYELMLNGDNIVRPNILTLCGENVISTGSQTSIQMINGDMTKSYILTYRFLPQKSCVIKPIEIEIDSKILKTNSVKVTVTAQKVDKNSPFILSLKSEKKQVYVGEEFEVTLLFKQRNDAEAIDSEFIAPNFKGFWIKEESEAKRYKSGSYTVTEKKYKLAAQRVGELKISPAQMRIAYRTHTRDPWAGVISRIRWKSNYSNELAIDVKPIPNSLSLIGNFSISAEVDKLSIKANEAVKVNIKVTGKGNLEDIQSFKPNIDGVNVFDEKINIVDGVLSQKMAFVSEHDFEVPSFSLKYYDPVAKKVKVVKTKPYNIKVENSKSNSEALTIKRDNSPKVDKTTNSDSLSKVSFNLSSLSALIIFLMGIVVGLFLSKIKLFVKNKKQDKLDLKDEKRLFIKLLPYKDDEDVKKILDVLESNIYSKKKQILDKKLLKEVIIRYKL